MKFDTDKKVVIIAPGFRAGNGVREDLRRFDVVTEKSEVITEYHQVRTIVVKRDRYVIVVYVDGFRWSANLHKWDEIKDLLDSKEVKYIEIAERETKEELINKFKKIYNDTPGQEC